MIGEDEMKPKKSISTTVFILAIMGVLTYVTAPVALVLSLYISNLFDYSDSERRLLKAGFVISYIISAVGFVALAVWFLYRKIHISAYSADIVLWVLIVLFAIGYFIVLFVFDARTGKY